MDVTAPVTNEPLRGLLPLICGGAQLSMEGAASGEGLALYDEVKGGGSEGAMVIPLDLDADLTYNEIGNGDIVIVQELLSEVGPFPPHPPPPSVPRAPQLPEIIPS